MTTEQFTLLKAEALPDIIADLEAAVAADTATAAAAAATAVSEAESAEDAALDAAASADAAEADANAAAAAVVLAQTASDTAQARARVAGTWTALAALTGTVAGESAEVLDADVGTHTDPVVGGTVDNAGTYSWSVSPAGWERIGATVLAGKVSITVIPSPLGFVDQVPLAAIGGDVVAWHDGDGVDMATSPVFDTRFGRGGADPSGDRVPLVSLGGDVVIHHDGLGVDMQTSPAFDARMGRGSAVPTGNQVPLAAIGGDVVIHHDGLGVDMQTSPAFDARMGRASVVPTGDRLPLASLGGDAAIWHDGDGVDFVPSPALVTTIADAIPAAPDRATATYGAWTLRDTRRILSRIINGATARLRICCIGDSYTDTQPFFIRPFVERMIAAFGDGGAGYCGFAWNSPAGATSVSAHKAARSDVTLTISAGWSSTWTAEATPDLGSISTATPGETLLIGFPAGNATAKLYGLCPGAAEIRYRWGAGAWVDLDVTGDGTLDFFDLAGMPGTSGTLTIETVSGIVTLTGIFFEGTGAGVVINKCARSGSYFPDWLGVTEAEWLTGINAMAPHLLIVMLGANDQKVNDAATFAANLGLFIDRLRVGFPVRDILFVMPPENVFVTKADTMANLAAAAYAVAVAKGIAFLDLQYFFGDDVDDYSWVGPRQYLASDTIHPSTTAGDDPDFPDGGYGNHVITDAVIRFLTS